MSVTLTAMDAAWNRFKEQHPTIATLASGAAFKAGYESALSDSKPQPKSKKCECIKCASGYCPKCGKKIAEVAYENEGEE